ncbi:MAG: hypothetical protein H0S79_19850 [Anaerolineaceae bacterium]|nr:hypothetical protein [Anaerolineaceae bacterium]
MKNYYEILEIDVTSENEEIEAKLDDEYTKWRGLVTHHDPEVVAEAQKALALLEEIRSVLLDPAKRTEYDANLISQQVGMSGLADPTVIPDNLPGRGGYGAPIRRKTEQPAQHSKPELDRTDAWICSNPSCKKANQIGTQFCSNCGNRIGFYCPKCGELVEIANKFCSHCGVEKEKYFVQQQEEKIKNLEKQLADQRNQLNLAETDPAQFARQYPVAGQTGKGCLILWVAMMAAGIGIGIGASADSAFLAVFLGLAGVVGATVGLKAVFRNGAVSNYIDTGLKPQIQSLQAQIKEVQKEKYLDR